MKPLTDWIDALIVELPLLWEQIKAGVYPASFLQNALGLSPEQTAELPSLLRLFVAVYFLCGLVTVALRFAKKQQSLNRTSQQITNGILMICCTLFIPALILLARGGIHVLQHEVAPCQGFEDLLRFIGEAAASIFYIVMAFGGILFTVWIPVGAALRYLKVYRLRGLPHMVLDLGFGPLVVAVFLLASACGKAELYLLILAAMILLTIVQTGGYIAEEVNTRAAQLRQEAESAYGKYPASAAPANQSTESDRPMDADKKL